MAVYDLYSKKQKRLRGEVPQTVIHDDLPRKLRKQISEVISDAIGEAEIAGRSMANSHYYNIYKILCREYGVDRLKTENRMVLTFQMKVLDFFEEADIDEALDVVQLSFQIINTEIRNQTDYKQTNRIKSSPDEAVEELNTRFRESGVGFQFERNEIIRVDSTYIYKEVTKPVINLLYNDKFQGANEEFMAAHEHYKHKKNKECLNECLKAFESVMKIICLDKKWEFQQNITANGLIDLCLKNSLIPTNMSNQFSSIRSLLETGIPSIRNKFSGHGQGKSKVIVSDSLARYALNLTGTNILFLIEQSELKD